MISNVVRLVVVCLAVALATPAQARSSGSDDPFESIHKLQQGGDFAHATTLSEEAVKQKPDSWAAHLELAKSLDGAGKYDAAIAEIFQSLNFNAKKSRSSQRTRCHFY